jgi:PD-(D/E)XK nuclease superfamily
MSKQNKDGSGRWLLYHPESDCYFEEFLLHDVTKSLISGEVLDVTGLEEHEYNFKHQGERPLTHGMIRVFNTCHEKARLSYVELWKPKTFHFPFVAGEAIHEGLQELLKYKDPDRAVQHAEDNLTMQQQKYIQQHLSMSADDDQELYQQRIYVEAIIRNYARFYKKFVKEVIVLSREKKIPAKERISDTMFVHTAKVDMIIKWLGKRYLYELKSAKTLVLDWLMGNKPQITGYWIRAIEKYRLDGVYLDAIQKPSIRMGKNEEKSEFLVRLEDYYSNADKYFYEIFTLSEREIEDYKGLIVMTASAFQEYLNSDWKGHWQRNRYSCKIMGSCEFLPICDYGLNQMNKDRYIKKTSFNEELEDLS